MPEMNDDAFRLGRFVEHVGAGRVSCGVAVAALALFALFRGLVRPTDRERMSHVAGSVASIGLLFSLLSVIGNAWSYTEAVSRSPLGPDRALGVASAVIPECHLACFPLASCPVARICQLVLIVTVRQHAPEDGQ